MKKSLDYFYNLIKDIHDGQIDKAGKPYIQHLYRVASKLSGCPDFVVVAALFHDSIEDQNITVADLHDFGLDSKSIQIIEILSKRKSETYDQYIDRIIASGNKWVTKIKLADNEDNLNRSSNVEKFSSLEKRYRKAREKLLKADG